MGSILASLHIDGTLFAQVVDFVILFAFLRIFAWPPLVKAMEQRRKHIEEQLAAAQGEREEAVRLREQQHQDLADARVQAQAILERAQRAAAEESRRLLEDARAQVERLQRQAHDEISHEREAAVSALRAEVADLVLLAAGKLLRSRVDAPEDQRLVEGFLVTSGFAPVGGAQ